MSLYNNNPEIRSRAQYTVQTNFGRIILLNLARGGFVIALLLIALMLSCSTIFSVIDKLSGYSSSYIERNPDVLLETLTPVMAAFTTPLMIGSLLTGVLNLGYTNGLLEMARGETVKASVVLSRLRHVLASLGLPMWVSLKTSVWMLPGVGVSVLGGIITALATNTYSFYRDDFGIAHIFAILGTILMFGGFIAMLVLTIPATYRYMMASYALADEPSLGVYDAVEKSKAMMKGRKFQLFKLTIPYMLIMLAILVVSTLLIAVIALLPNHVIVQFISAVLLVAIAVLMVAAPVYLNLLQEMAIACFYEENKD